MSLQILTSNSGFITQLFIDGLLFKHQGISVDITGVIYCNTHASRKGPKHELFQIKILIAKTINERIKRVSQNMRSKIKALKT